MEIGSKIGSLAIKDFTWEINNGRAKIKKVPLGQGIVDLDGFFKNIKNVNITAPLHCTLSIHYWKNMRKISL